MSDGKADVGDWVATFNDFNATDQRKALKLLLKTKYVWMDEKQQNAASSLVKTLTIQKSNSLASAKSPTPGSSGTPKKKDKSIFDKLTDPSLYTGSHKERFDENGKGKGLAGRDPTPKGDGYIGNGGAVIANRPVRTNTEPPPSNTEAPKKKSTTKKEPTVTSPPKGRVAVDGMCKFCPEYGCSVSSCELKCLHCGEGYCTSCLWGVSGKMAALDKCANCGKKPRSLPRDKREAWE